MSDPLNQLQRRAASLAADLTTIKSLRALREEREGEALAGSTRSEASAAQYGTSRHNPYMTSSSIGMASHAYASPPRTSSPPRLSASLFSSHNMTASGASSRQVELEIELSRAKGEISALQRELADCQRGSHVVANQRRGDEERYEQLLRTHRTTERELVACKDSYASLQSRIRDLEHTIELKERNSKEKVEDLSSRLSSTVLSSQLTNEKVVELTRELQHARDNATEANLALSSANARVISLEERLIAAQSDVESYKTRLESERARHEETAARLNSLRDAHARLSQSAADAKQRVADLERGGEDMRQKLEERNEEAKLLRAQLAAARATAAKLTAAVATASSVGVGGRAPSRGSVPPIPSPLNPSPIPSPLNKETYVGRLAAWLLP
jgi:DNA repair exonuclease SbcCD ATPase subunit